ncbi:hypothetical protein [Pseudomonas denitrificans (nom. rej.)]|uniref:Autotransporter outer membrane beta-barrel domain-containing protein n=1 Tax=Pseudomonas denitrificans TaxID=43306 RepID=A0A9X7R3U2_PSEDE|nr:hypothetical protein [Pseudomonas denitrificans (nom. rej.)]QEY71663.1 hypothetical protein F1C79_08485 [Pseudomonas denitrificans (nom. rej.)]
MKSSYKRHGMQRTCVRAPQLSAITLALVAANLAPQVACAGVYTASNQSELQAAVVAANADADSSSTINLTASFSFTGATLVTTKSITIDTQGFVLTSIYSTIPINSNYTFEGTYVGAASATTPGYGLAVGNGVFVNNGTVTGGQGIGSNVSGNTGLAVSTRATLTNNGTITGGAATNFNASSTGLGSGVSLASTASNLVNSGSGVIVGGTSDGGVSAAGVFNGVSVGTSIINQGIIRGGAALNGGTGGMGIRLTQGTSTITNSGLIEAGDGAAAIYMFRPTGNLTIVNSGRIHAGSGYANAVEFATGAGLSTLEL